MPNAWNTKKKKIVMLNKSQIEKILYETGVNANIEHGANSKVAKAVNSALDWIQKFIDEGKADAILTFSEESEDGPVTCED